MPRFAVHYEVSGPDCECAFLNPLGPEDAFRRAAAEFQLESGAVYSVQRITIMEQYISRGEVLHFTANPAPGEDRVSILYGPDSRGRHGFVVEWIEPSGRHRGQVFLANLAERMERIKRYLQN